MSINPEIQKKMYQLLQEISEYTDLEAVAIVNREGRKIAFFAKKGADPDLLAAISAAVLSTGEQVVSAIEQGELLEVLIRGDKGFSILTNAREYILIGSSFDLNAVGLTIRVLRKYAGKLLEIVGGKNQEEIGPINLK